MAWGFTNEKIITNISFSFFVCYGSFIIISYNVLITISIFLFIIKIKRKKYNIMEKRNAMLKYAYETSFELKCAYHFWVDFQGFL